MRIRPYLIFRLAVATALCAAYGLSVLPGCSKDDPAGPGDGNLGPIETVSAPETPAGVSVVAIDEAAMYSAVGAASSLQHELEYQFDFDAGGQGSLGAWLDDETVSHSWSVAGTYAVKARARCKLHPTVLSAWSEALDVQVGLNAETELFKITTTYRVGGQTFVDSIDFADATPDTVPFGSWLTLYYRGLGGGGTLNRFQMRYERESARNALSFADIPWLPPTAENSNGGAPWDSSSMNMGSVEYDIFVRTVDFFNRPDPTPATVTIVANFDPILDGFQLLTQAGARLAANDTLEFDWSAPADSGFTPGFTARFKTFFFVIEAMGHDHPMDPDTSAVKAWLYEFQRVDDPNKHEVFARSGGWFDSDAVNTLRDTAWVRIEYPLGDVNGDEVFANPPRWHDSTLDFSIRGRDARNLDRFQQVLVYAQQQNLTNDYFAGRFGRWTEEGQQRLHMRLVR